MSLGSAVDYAVNGLIVGNIYALLAVGLALIFGVSHLVNFAHGSVFAVGAYVGLAAISLLGTPLPLTLLLVACAGGALGLVIERIGLRPLAGSARIAPLLATIGISFVLDQCVQLVAGAEPRALPSQLPAWRLHVGGGTIGALDLLIAGVGILSALVLFLFLRYSRLGWAVRAVAQDREAALQMGVDADRVNATVFAIAGGLGAVSGLLVGMYYNQLSPAMSFNATLKGVVAQVIGGMGNIPGAIAGGLLLGLTESFGVAAFGSSMRNLFAFVLLIAMLALRPEGLFTRARGTPPEPLTGSFVAPSRPLRVPRWAPPLAMALLALLPLAAPDQGYLIQTLTNAFLYGVLALSLTLVAGTLGQVSLGHAGLLAIGAYASALLATRAGLPVLAAIPLAGLLAAAIGTAIIWPSFRLRGHSLSIATLGVGEIVALVILNWDGLTGGPVGVLGIPGPSLTLGGTTIDLGSAEGFYWLSLLALAVLWAAAARLLSSHLGRTFRALRDDDIAARAFAVRPGRYKALGFACSGFMAGIAGAVFAHLFSYINHESFTAQISVLALTMVILGGLGNLTGAVVGAAALIGLPELFRFTAEYRILIYGLVLLLLVRFRPQGLFGTV